MAAAVSKCWCCGDRIHCGRLGERQVRPYVGSGRVARPLWIRAARATRKSRSGRRPDRSRSSRRAIPCPTLLDWRAPQRIAALLTGLTERDLVLVLISGGGSALLPLPVEGICLPDYRRLTNVAASASGADITRDQRGAQALFAAAGRATGPAGRAGAGRHADPLGCGRHAARRHCLRADRAGPQHIRRRLGSVGAVRHRRRSPRPACASICAGGRRARLPIRRSRATRCSSGSTTW